MKTRTIISKPAGGRPEAPVAASAFSHRRSHVSAMPREVAALHVPWCDDEFTIVRPREPIPIERTLNGRHLMLHVGRTAVVLIPSQARRLAYSLLLEAETDRHRVSR